MNSAMKCVRTAGGTVGVLRAVVGTGTGTGRYARRPATYEGRVRDFHQ